MTGVERVQVGDVLKLDRTQIAPDPLTQYVAVGVRSFGRGLFHYEPTTGDKLGKLRFFDLPPGRLVISNIKAWEGAVALSGAADLGCVASNRFLIYDACGSQIDLGWARWFLLSEPGNELLQRASPGSADRNRTLAARRFEDLVIPLPSIDEQRRVADRLNRASVQIDAISARTHSRPRSDIRFLPAFTDLRVGQSTAIETLGDLVDLVSDIVHPGDDPSPAESFVGLQHVESHSGRNLGSDPLPAMKGRKFRFAPGDIIYGYLRPYLNKVWVADRHGLCSVDQYVIRPKPGTDGELLAYVLRGQSVLDRAIELTHSLQLPRLRSGLLLGLDVAWPERDQRTMLTRLDRTRALFLRLADARQRQSRALSALLPATLNEEFAAGSD